MRNAFLPFVAALVMGLSQPAFSQVVLSLDINERGQDPGGTTYPGFDAFLIDSVGSATLGQTNPTTLGFGAITVTLSGNGANPNYDDRIRATPVNAGDFTQSLLFRDFVFSPSTAANAGLNVDLTGLIADAVYKVTIWSYDSGSPRNRVSDWFANGFLMRDNYTFNGSNAPTNDTQYQFEFKARADASGRVLVQGRRDGSNAAGDPGVFLNALQLALDFPDAPGIAAQPAPVTLYAGENAIFSVQASGTPPFTYQWRKGMTDITGATNPTLVVFNSQAGDAADYSVFVVNEAGNATSDPAALTVLPVDNLLTALTSYWPLDGFDEAVLTTPDVTANLNHLTQTNMDLTNLSPGRHGSAISFTDTNEVLYRKHPSSGLPLYPNVGYSVTLWVKGVGIGQSDRRVFSESSDLSNNPLMTLGTHSAGSSGVVDIFIRNGNGVTPINHRRSSLIAFDGDWHHIAWVDNNGFPGLYVDGVRDTNDFNYTRGVLTPTIVSLGGVLRTNLLAVFSGAIDDAAVWRRSLSAEEVRLVYTAGPRLSLLITRTEVSGGNVILDFLSAAPNAAHGVDRKPTVDAAMWNGVMGVNFGLPVGNSISATFPLPPGDQNFFRVVIP